MKMLAFAIALTACGGGMKRTPAAYRTDTQQLLASRTPDLETCYAKTLANNPTAGGLVTVTFHVDKKTGKLTHTALDQARSTAPEPVALCVLESLAGLTLQPPDRSEGQATFAYELRPAG